MKLLFFVFAVIAVVTAYTDEEKDIIRRAQTTLFKETQNFAIAFGGPQIRLADASEFESFKQQFGKSYQSREEEALRFQIFRVNQYLAAFYQMFEQGTARYGVTKFSDLSTEEFKLMYRNAQFDLRPSKEAELITTTAPDSVDWRDKGAVTEVKNQGQCGSCWAFSTTGNIEGQWFLKKGQLISLSEQELVDCDKVDQGCNGGLPSQAYKEIIRLGGMVTEKSYAYTAKDGSCSMNKGDVVVTISGSEAISQDETQMASWCATNGPISIGINAAMMQFYTGGVSHPWKFLCNPANLDHGVLIVGYGTQDNKPYWIVKNSWGPDWGEKGYYLVYRGDGTCGLNKMCTSSTVA